MSRFFPPAPINDPGEINAAALSNEPFFWPGTDHRSAPINDQWASEWLT
jgi:hypothetical protein